MMSIFPAQIEAWHRGRNDIAHAGSDHPPEAPCASGRQSRRTVAGRDLRMKLVFVEPRYALPVHKQACVRSPPASSSGPSRLLKLQWPPALIRCSAAKFSIPEIFHTTSPNFWRCR
jgi:hypothetical protein